MNKWSIIIIIIIIIIIMNLYFFNDFMTTGQLEEKRLEYIQTDRQTHRQ